MKRKSVRQVSGGRLLKMGPVVGKGSLRWISAQAGGAEAEQMWEKWFRLVSWRRQDGGREHSSLAPSFRAGRLGTAPLHPSSDEEYEGLRLRENYSGE